MSCAGFLGELGLPSGFLDELLVILRSLLHIWGTEAWPTDAQKLDSGRSGCCQATDPRPNRPSAEFDRPSAKFDLPARAHAKIWAKGWGIRSGMTFLGKTAGSERDAGPAWIPWGHWHVDPENLIPSFDPERGACICLYMFCTRVVHFYIRLE